MALSSVEKLWSFDFRSNPEKYHLNKKFNNFYRIFINFQHKNHLIIFAFQGTNEGRSLGLFVGKLEKSEIIELAYIDEFFSGKFIDV